MSSKSENKNIYGQKLSSFLSSYFVKCISINAIAIEVWFTLNHNLSLFSLETYCLPFLNKTLRKELYVQNGLP